MNVTRRQGVLTIVTVLGGLLLRAFSHRHLPWKPGADQEGRISAAPRPGGPVPRRVEPDPHSVKRHG